MCWPQQVYKSNLHICIWKVSLRTFRKLYCLLFYDLLFRRYWGLKLKNFVKFLPSQDLFDILIANISWTVARNPIKQTIFWKSIMRTFRSTYVNSFIRIRLFAEVSTKLQEVQLFGQFKGHNSESEHGN